MAGQHLYYEDVRGILNNSSEEELSSILNKSSYLPERIFQKACLRGDLVVAKAMLDTGKITDPFRWDMRDPKTIDGAIDTMYKAVVGCTPLRVERYVFDASVIRDSHTFEVLVEIAKVVPVVEVSIHSGFTFGRVEMNTGITSNLFQALTQTSRDTLEVVQLSSDYTSSYRVDEEIQELCKLVKECEHITRLVVFVDGLNDDHITLIYNTIAECGRMFEYIDVSGEDITSATLPALLNLISKDVVKILDVMNDNYEWTNELLDTLRGLHNLRYLTLRYSDPNDDDDRYYRKVDEMVYPMYTESRRILGIKYMNMEGVIVG